VSPSLHVLLTGGAGFIGSHLVDLLMLRADVEVTVLDKLTYAGNLANLERHEGNARLRVVRGDIADPGVVGPLVEQCTRVIHAAAESFVDRSIEDSSDFIRTNLLGTQVMLEACRRTRRPILYVSTDEVYGSIQRGSFTEEDALRPNSPYAASKAAGDLLCRAYFATYDLPVTIVRGSNAYGPRQHPEKAIPTFVLAAIEGKDLPVYGDGTNRREWLFVRDFVRAILTVMDRGKPGRIYNIGGGHEMSNIELARLICELLGVPTYLARMVPDRPGHDFRYSLSWEALAALGWKPEVPFEEGLPVTVSWYRENERWWRRALEGAR
jgi:dTDP-glucose 4,6-dehydratase